MLTSKFTAPDPKLSSSVLDPNGSEGGELNLCCRGSADGFAPIPVTPALAPEREVSTPNRSLKGRENFVTPKRMVFRGPIH